LIKFRTCHTWTYDIQSYEFRTYDPMTLTLTRFTLRLSDLGRESRISEFDKMSIKLCDLRFTQRWL
jgi:hypothetical protein